MLVGMDKTVKVLHIIGLAFLGCTAYSLKKKYQNIKINIQEIIFNSFINGIFGLTIGLFVAAYTDNIYFILSMASITGLYGDRIISSILRPK